eukprot:maker-scaffold15_size728074-snap-gene-4.18 protein:Tk08857 transcript:maker-scaffold15_size728074-snap-gene-4.18-mRNA-1 annotation:"t-box transcription factor tbx18 isoform x1"
MTEDKTIQENPDSNQSDSHNNNHLRMPPLSFSMDKILAKANDSKSGRKSTADLEDEPQPSKCQKLDPDEEGSDSFWPKDKEDIPLEPTTPLASSPLSSSVSPISIPPMSPREGESPVSSTTSSPSQSSSSLCSPGFLEQNGVRVELMGQELWKKFHRLSTEMIITKAGRRMFPTLKVRLSGLIPSQSYMVFLDLVPYDDKRYRYVYHSSQWMIAGAGDPHPSPNTFIHGDSPSAGSMWESQGAISFDKLKLTNNRSSIIQGQICLHSMHKYIPRIHVQPLSADQVKSGEVPMEIRRPRLFNPPDFFLRPGIPLETLVDVENSLSFTFPETVFTTVTAYQNQQITKLKIASNPFAKGFREATRTRDPSYPEISAFYGHPHPGVYPMDLLRFHPTFQPTYPGFMYHSVPPPPPLWASMCGVLPPFMPLMGHSAHSTPGPMSQSSDEQSINK